MLEGVDFTDPTKFHQPVEIPEGETWSEFWRWWKETCAVMDEKPKQGIRRMALIPTDTKRGRNHPKDSKKILGARFIK